MRCQSYMSEITVTEVIQRTFLHQERNQQDHSPLWLLIVALEQTTGVKYGLGCSVPLWVMLVPQYGSSLNLYGRIFLLWGEHCDSVTLTIPPPQRSQYVTTLNSYMSGWSSFANIMLLVRSYYKPP